MHDKLALIAHQLTSITAVKPFWEVAARKTIADADAHIAERKPQPGTISTQFARMHIDSSYALVDCKVDPFLLSLRQDPVLRTIQHAYTQAIQSGKSAQVAEEMFIPQALGHMTMRYTNWEQHQRTIAENDRMANIQRKDAEKRMQANWEHEQQEKQQELDRQLQEKAEFQKERRRVAHLQQLWNILAISLVSCDTHCNVASVCFCAYGLASF